MLTLLVSKTLSSSFVAASVLGPGTEEVATRGPLDSSGKKAVSEVKTSRTIVAVAGVASFLNVVVIGLKMTRVLNDRARAEALRMEAILEASAERVNGTWRLPAVTN